VRLVSHIFKDHQEPLNQQQSITHPRRHGSYIPEGMDPPSIVVVSCLTLVNKLLFVISFKTFHSEFYPILFHVAVKLCEYLTGRHS